jgi:hypothetical protein
MGRRILLKSETGLRPIFLKQKKNKKHKSVLMFTKVAENAVRQFQCITEPCDAKNSWFAAKFQACVVLLPRPPVSNAKARPRIDTFPVNCVLHMAPQVEVGRCEIGRSRRPHNRSVSSYPFIWVVRVQKLLYVACKWGAAPSIILNTQFFALPVAHPPVAEVIFQLKSEQEASESRGCSSYGSMRRSPIILVNKAVATMCLQGCCGFILGVEQNPLFTTCN